MKKADLSINMIIIIAIGLVILLIVIYLLISRSNNLRDNTSCIDKGGVCTASQNCPEYTDQIGVEYCKGRDMMCCKPGGIRIASSS